MRFGYRDYGTKLEWMTRTLLRDCRRLRKPQIGKFVIAPGVDGEFEVFISVRPAKPPRDEKREPRDPPDVVEAMERRRRKR